MPKYPVIKTSLPGFVLQPLQSKHIPFLVQLLSNPEIQATLFRKPTAIDSEKEAKALERMYEKSPSKEITYILTITKLMAETYIGYVTIKLIDWNVKSCYLSVALLPDQQYRGKGYAKHCYDAFFAYLFSIGIMKIYGRTHENNIPTIKLNEATGFQLIGRQHSFILYPNKTRQDDLLFERLNPELDQYTHINDGANKQLASIFGPLQAARQNGTVDKPLLDQVTQQLAEVSPHPNASINVFIADVHKELEAEMHSLSQSTEAADKFSATRRLIQENADCAGYSFLGMPITLRQMDTSRDILNSITQLSAGGTDLSDKQRKELNAALWYGAYTTENWNYLRLLFLGKIIKHSIVDIIATINHKK